MFLHKVELEEQDDNGNTPFEDSFCDPSYDTYDYDPIKRPRRDFEHDTMFGQSVRSVKVSFSSNGCTNTNPSINDSLCEDDNFINRPQVIQMDGFGISTFDNQYEQMRLDDKLLMELHNIGIYPELVARLNDLITSGVKAVLANGSSKKPWMVVGAGLPLNAAELLPTLVKLTKKVTEQMRVLAKDEDEKLAETTSYDVIPPYDQARALGKTNIDVDRVVAGLPCESEGFLLMYARWRNVERDLYNERKDRYDITQIPDVYDSCKYCLLHNAHLNIDGLDELFKVAQVPHNISSNEESSRNVEHEERVDKS